MFNWSGRNSTPRKSLRTRLLLETLEDRCTPSAFVQTNLTSDLTDVGQPPADSSLVNPWGLAYNGNGPFWVSDNGTGVSTLYNAQGQNQGLTVTIPPPGGSPGGTLAAPDGIVGNTNGSAFLLSGASNSSADFIFATEDGTISGWSFNVNQNNAILKVDNSSGGTGAVYKGLTIGTDSSNRLLLYVTNFRAGTVDVFDDTFTATTVTGGFKDNNLPAGFAPFGIQNINGKIYVTYAKQNSPKHDDVPGPGLGVVDVFNTDGKLLERLASGGPLNAPWGLAAAPAGFGGFGGDILVGNFGDGHISVYNPANGHFLGQLQDASGHAIAIDGLWGLDFGNNGAAGPSTTLFFTAGLDGETHGLFGSLQAIPTLSTSSPIVPNLANAPEQIINTSPASGDANPYGVAFVPQSFPAGGAIQPGDILVANFNSSSGNQGTGTTIMRITPDGQQSVFFQGQAPLGLTTALGVLSSGFVIVGNVPNVGGVVGSGSLLIIDSKGNLVETISDNALLDGPWDLAINDQGSSAQVFVSNVLSGTVSRINLNIPAVGAPVVESITQIASGYVHTPDISALEIGPTGLAYNQKKDILYVASTGDNEIFAVAHAGSAANDAAGTGKLIYQDSTHLHGPLGLVLAPNGDLITADGDAENPDAAHVNEIVEFTTKGQFVGQMPVDTSAPTTPGAAFGIALSTSGGEIRFAAVDDNSNTVNVWTFLASSGSGHGHGKADRMDLLEAAFESMLLDEHMNGGSGLHLGHFRIS